MPNTIPGGFQGFKANLEITDLQATTVSTRQKNVRAAVEAQLEVLDSFVAGSYNRNTMISPLKKADVDIFVVLRAKYWSTDGHASVLDRVKRALLKTYKTPDISRNGQAITIRFDDFLVDVVPCFNRNGGGYLIADTILKRWIPTNPKAHLDIWSDANHAHDGDLIPLIKMLKSWNRSTDALRSFPLETLTLKVMDGVTISDFPSGVRYFFDKSRERIPNKISDLAGYSDDVAAYLTKKADIDAVIAKLDRGLTRALNAEKAANAGKISDAFYWWRLIFPDHFPAYS